jgi:hypothetical protein
MKGRARGKSAVLVSSEVKTSACGTDEVCSL